MEKKVICTSGAQKTIVSFTGLPQSTIQDWISRPSHANYELCQKMIADLVKAQEKVLDKWSKNKQINAAIAKHKSRKKRSK